MTDDAQPDASSPEDADQGWLDLDLALAAAPAARRGRPRLVVAAGVLAALAVAGAVVLFLRGGTSDHLALRDAPAGPVSSSPTLSDPPTPQESSSPTAAAEPIVAPAPTVTSAAPAPMATMAAPAPAPTASRPKTQAPAVITTTKPTATATSTASPTPSATRTAAHPATVQLVNNTGLPLTFFFQFSDHDRTTTTSTGYDRTQKWQVPAGASMTVVVDNPMYGSNVGAYYTAYSQSDCGWEDGDGPGPKVGSTSTVTVTETSPGRAACGNHGQVAGALTPTENWRG